MEGINKNIMIRKLEKSDDLEKVACLIYKTDVSLFSFLFGKYEKAIPKIKKLVLLENNTFSHKYTYCSFERETQGILIAYGHNEINEKNQDKDYKEVFSLFELLSLSIKDPLVRFTLTKAQPQEIYIQNICVEQKCRGKGIGTSLLMYIIDWAKSQGMNSLSLDVSIANEKAKRLYERLGFGVVQKKVYPFTSKGSYRMELYLKKNRG